MKLLILVNKLLIMMHLFSIYNIILIIILLTQAITLGMNHNITFNYTEESFCNNTLINNSKIYLVFDNLNINFFFIRE